MRKTRYTKPALAAPGEQQITTKPAATVNGRKGKETQPAVGWRGEPQITRKPAETAQDQ